MEKLEIKYDTKKNSIGTVVCPRIKTKVNACRICRSCEWLSMYIADSIRCRWSQEKEDLKYGKKYYAAP